MDLPTDMWRLILCYLNYIVTRQVNSTFLYLGNDIERKRKPAIKISTKFLRYYFAKNLPFSYVEEYYPQTDVSTGMIVSCWNNLNDIYSKSDTSTDIGRCIIRKYWDNTNGIYCCNQSTDEDFNLRNARNLLYNGFNDPIRYCPERVILYPSIDFIKIAISMHPLAIEPYFYINQCKRTIKYYLQKANNRSWKAVYDYYSEFLAGQLNLNYTYSLPVPTELIIKKFLRMN